MSYEKKAAAVLFADGGLLLFFAESSTDSDMRFTRLTLEKLPRPMLFKILNSLINL